MAKARLLVFDGTSWSISPAEVTKDGTIKYGHNREVAYEMAQAVGDDLFIVAADAPVLASESDFHLSRRRVALGALFRNTGDFMELVRLGGFALLVVLGIWNTTAISSVSSNVGAISRAVHVSTK